MPRRASAARSVAKAQRRHPSPSTYDASSPTSSTGRRAKPGICVSFFMNILAPNCSLGIGCVFGPDLGLFSATGRTFGSEWPLSI
jgi:hypothetical protein